MKYKPENNFPVLICDVCGFGMPENTGAFIAEDHFHLCDDCLAALKEMVTEKRKSMQPFKNINKNKKHETK